MNCAAGGSEQTDDRMETLLESFAGFNFTLLFYINSISPLNESWQSLGEVLKKVGITGVMSCKAFHNYGSME